MADFDGGFKIVARSSGAGLSRLGGVPVDLWEPIGDTLQTTERLADRAFRAEHGPSRFVVYMEAYTRWVESAPLPQFAVFFVRSLSGLLVSLCGPGPEPGSAGDGGAGMGTADRAAAARICVPASV